MSHDRPQKITLSEMHTFGVRSFTSSVHDLLVRPARFPIARRDGLLCDFGPQLRTGHQPPVCLRTIGAAPRELMPAITAPDAMAV
jgi:hypothetical protein